MPKPKRIDTEIKIRISRAGKCIDNGPMKDFWGILERELHYGRRFARREEFVKMIGYYTRTTQPSLMPMEKHCGYPFAA